MAEYLIQSETLDNIADAINAKTGKSVAMTPAQMVTEIESIQTGGGGVSLANVDVYIADYVTEVPMITSGALNSRYGYIVGV